MPLFHFIAELLSRLKHESRLFIQPRRADSGELFLNPDRNKEVRDRFFKSC